MSASLVTTATMQLLLKRRRSQKRSGRTTVHIINIFLSQFFSHLPLDNGSHEKEWSRDWSLLLDKYSIYVHMYCLFPTMSLSVGLKIVLKRQFFYSKKSKDVNPTMPNRADGIAPYSNRELVHTLYFWKALD